MATRSEVVEFLNLFKACLQLDTWHVRQREKNSRAQIDLQLTENERRDILLQIKADDYVDGPKPDDTDASKEVWEFGKDVAGTEVYIKLRVIEDPRKSHVHHALVWSFHPAEHRLRYPLRGGGGS